MELTSAATEIPAATNEDMQSAVAEKRFRQDLYHRIKEYTLHIPPLPECHENIMPLAEFFRELANGEFGKRVKGFNAEARKRMLVHPWSGNVRELKGTVRSAVLLTDGDTITADKLNFEEPLLSGEASLSLKGLMNPSFRHEWRLTTYGIIRKKKIKRCKWAFVH